LNPGRRGGKPATDRLSYGAAYRPLTLSVKMTMIVSWEGYGVKWP
jgi:hypothetical protein